MPLYRASLRHTFNSGGTVELTSKPYPANSWEHARELTDAFSYEDVRIAVADIDEKGIPNAYLSRLTISLGKGGATLYEQLDP